MAVRFVSGKIILSWSSYPVNVVSLKPPGLDDALKFLEVLVNTSPKKSLPVCIVYFAGTSHLEFEQFFVTSPVSLSWAST